jgi:hypothetical protein
MARELSNAELVAQISTVMTAMAGQSDGGYHAKDGLVCWDTTIKGYTPESLWPFIWDRKQYINHTWKTCNIDIGFQLHDTIAAIAKDPANPTKRELAESLLIVLRMHQ